MSKQAKLSIRIDSELKEAFKRLARKHDIPMSALVRYWITDGIEEDRWIVDGEYLRKKVQYE